jgi:hypothetical protein
MVPFLGVVAHPLLQVLGLSDVEDFSLGVQVKVAALEGGGWFRGRSFFIGTLF